MTGTCVETKQVRIVCFHEDVRAPDADAAVVMLRRIVDEAFGDGT